MRRTPTQELDIRRGTAVTKDGVRIAYQASGNGPPLVFCHAMGSDHRMFDQHRAVFSHAFTFITFDQRGAGESDHPPFVEGPESAYTVDSFGEDLEAVLDALGLSRACILGFSMGAVAALSFATRWPDRVERLVLASAMASRLPQPIIDRARLVEEMLDERGISETYDFYFSGALFDGLMERKAFREVVAQGKSRATYHGFKGCFRVTIDRPSLLERLVHIQCPTLILVGENDTHYLEEARLLERTFDNAKRLVMPKVGHPLAFQDPRGFESNVLAFLG